MTDYYKLIPDLEKWGDLNGHPFEPEAWLCGIGAFDQAIAYSTIFWPAMLEYDDCIFVGEIPPASNYEDWMNSTNGQKDRVEAVINHLHIVDLFSAVQPTSEQAAFLGQKLREMWQAKASMDHPDRNIVVEYYEGHSEDLSEFQVTLFQRRSGGA